MTHSEAPPAWAMEKAREVVSRFMISSYYSEYKSTVAIARALAEADRAATERAAVWHENEAHWIELEAHRKRGALAKTLQPMWHRRAAAAIRKGAGQ